MCDPARGSWRPGLAKRKDDVRGTIYMDEAGYTGNHLLDPTQPVFVYSSVNIDNVMQASSTVKRITRKFNLQGQELKGKNLAKHGRGRAALSEILDEYADDIYVNVYEKRYALACKFFEYTFEPILSSHSALFYGIDFHRFIAQLMYLELSALCPGIGDSFAAFEDVMRKGDYSRVRDILAPGGTNPNLLEPTNMVLCFLEIHRERFCREIEDARDSSSWVLDLSLGAVMDLLRYWGLQHSTVSAICDESRPLKFQEHVFQAMVGCEKRAYIALGSREPFPLTFNLSGPIILADSKATPGLQIADAVAAATALMFREPDSESAKQWRPIIGPKIGAQSIVPMMDEFRLSERHCFVGAIVLHHLVEQSVRRNDLCDRIEELVYHANAQFERARATQTLPM